ncbi:MAG TPA: MFS transporter [Cyanobacteria bacterium UBA8543]|nr:MFS transporter [Cyanobacteria bacterium UBA8543]
MKIFSTLEPQPRRNLLVLFAAGLFFWSSLASLLPTLPLYVEDVGGTTQHVGLVMGSFAVGLLLFRPWLGKLSDQRSRKLVVLIGMAAVALAPLGYLFVKSIPLLMLIRVFHGISIAAYTTGNTALVVDLSPVRQRGEIIGYMSLTNPIGVATGPAIGGLLQAQAGYTPLFLFSFGLGLLGFFCTFLVKEPRLSQEFVEVTLLDDQNGHPTDKVSVNPKSDKFWQLLISPRLRIPTLVLLLIGIVFGSLATFVALYIRETKLDFNAGWFYSAAAMSSFCIRIITGRASDRYGRGLFITGSLICYGLSMLLLSLAQSPVHFLLAGLIEGAGAGTLIPMTIALISDRSYSYERGRVFALCIGGFDLGMAIAGPVFGTFAEQLSYQGIFALSTGLSFLALIVFITYNSKDLHHSLRFATGRGQDVYALDNMKS